MAQIIKWNGWGWWGKLSNYVADVSYENWSDLDKAISGKKVYDKVSSMVTDIWNKQDQLTPWTWIDITSNVISTTALPWTTKYWASFVLSIDSSTYVVTAQLKDQDGNNLWSSQTIDLPLESVVVNGRYDDATKKIILTLQNWNTIEFSVSDLVSWLQTEITNDNKLSADLVDDTSTTNKFVTAADKSTWDGKQDALTAWQWINITGSTIKTTYNYWESTTAAATAQKEVSIPWITELNVWQVVIVKPTITSTVADSTLKVNNFTAYPMLYNGAAITTSTDSIVWAANVPSMFILDDVSWTKYWRFLWHWLDSNTTYSINYSYDAWKMQSWSGSYAISRYSICMQKANWTWEKITATNANYSTWTTKSVNTNWFIPTQIRYYNTTTNLANGAYAAVNTLYDKCAKLTASYSFNCWTAPWWAVWNNIYLVWTFHTDWLFYLDSTKRWDNALPTSNNWKYYIWIGNALTTTDSTMTLSIQHPIFFHDWTSIREYYTDKQDRISDLATIRSWAAAWATALQSGDNISELNNDSWFITSSALNWYQTTANLVTNLTSPDDTHYPSAKAVADALSGAWAGDMLKSVYDPNSVEWNAFDYNNFINTPTIPTKTSDLNNDSWFVTNQVDDTAYWSGWDWKTTKAPSQNAVYDKISAMDTTISGKQDTLSSQTAYTSKWTASKVPQITTNSLWQVTNITEVSITYPSQVDDTAYANTWDGVTWTAPSKNAVYDKISSMDTTISSKAADSDVVKLTWDQTIAWTKTFSTSPVVPSKSTDAANTATAIATEAQVYKKQDKLTTQTAYTSKWTSTKVATITTNTLWQVTAITETAITFPVTSVNWSTWAVTGLQTQHSTLSVTLAAANWSSNTITVSATWVTASNTVIVSPAPSSFSAYTSGVVYCSAQTSGSLTFSCTTEPTSDITVNVLILN